MAQLGEVFSIRNLIAAGAAVVTVLGAWLLIRSFQQESPQPEVQVAQEPAPPPAPVPEVEPEAPPPPPEPTYPSVLVASQDIARGVPIKRNFVEWREWRDPVDLQTTMVQDTTDISEVLEAMAVHPIKRGEPVTWRHLIKPGDPGFVTADLRPGHRAMTVEVDQATTVARLIYPGDRVDVIWIFDRGLAGDFADLGPGVRVLVRNVRVLAVGSSTLALGRYGAGSFFRRKDANAAPLPEGDTYTLEVTPADAERLALGVATGRITLSMRPLRSQETEPDSPRLTNLYQVLPTPKSAPVEVETAESPPPLPPPPARVRVFRGGIGPSSETAIKPAETVDEPPVTTEGTSQA